MLYRARQRRDVFSVVLDSEADLRALSVPRSHAAACDTIERWRLVSIRDERGQRSTLHILSWRKVIDGVWITASLKGACKDSHTARTTSGDTYRLADAGAGEIQEDLRAHLLYALDRWGFTLVAD